MAAVGFENRAVLLSLRFKPVEGPYPRPDEVGSVLQDLEGLYRAAPVASALGVPVAELLAAYHIVRAETAAGELSPDWHALGRWLPLPEYEDFAYFSRRARLRGRRSSGPDTQPANAMRVRGLSMGSPLDFLAQIPPEYWTGGGFVLFLKAVERFFNMPQRIRTERIDLRARQAERRADERDAELREDRATRELEGLNRERPPLRLIDGEVRPDDDGPDAA